MVLIQSSCPKIIPVHAPRMGHTVIHLLMDFLVCCECLRQMIERYLEGEETTTELTSSLVIIMRRLSILKMIAFSRMNTDDGEGVGISNSHSKLLNSSTVEVLL